jgi:hypothetical protein
VELCDREPFGVCKEVDTGVQVEGGTVSGGCFASAPAPIPSVQVDEGIEMEGAHVVCGDGGRLKGRAEIEAAEART